MSRSQASPENVLRTEFSEPFVQGMRDRMVVSFFKYGPLANAYPGKVNAIASLKQRLEKYEATGNTEYLIDAANFAMIEFMRPAHREAHFTPTDSDGSPGRTTTTGAVTTGKNADLKSLACPKCESPSEQIIGGRKCTSKFCLYQWAPR